jgi:hypothetical protein
MSTYSFLLDIFVYVYMYMYPFLPLPVGCPSYLFILVVLGFEFRASCLLVGAVHLSHSANPGCPSLSVSTCWMPVSAC